MMTIVNETFKKQALSSASLNNKFIDGSTVSQYPKRLQRFKNELKSLLVCCNAQHDPDQA